MSPFAAAVWLFAPGNGARVPRLVELHAGNTMLLCMLATYVSWVDSLEEQLHGDVLLQFFSFGALPQCCAGGAHAAY